MISRCLEEKRALGVLLVRKGSEVGGAVVPCEAGATAVIAGTDMDDGRMSIAPVGRTGFACGPKQAVGGGP